VEASHNKISVSKNWPVAVKIVTLQASLTVKSTPALITELIIS
jgi:hypothetical protein